MSKAKKEQYEKAEQESDHFEWEYGKEINELDRMLSQVPQEYWIQ